MSRQESKILNRNQMIYRLREFMLDQPSVRFAYLYGSRALGFGRLDSDVDIAAYFDANGDIAPEVTLQEKLSHELSLPVVVINLNERPAAEFFKRVLPRAKVIKDSPERIAWQEGRGVMSDEDRGTIKDFLSVTLEAMSEKNVMLREGLPQLEKVDLDQVRAGNKDAITVFLGTFMLFFQPFESIAHRMSNYLHLTTKREYSPELMVQVQILCAQLEMDEVSTSVLAKIARVRNKVAHAYWDVKKEELNNDDLKVARQALEVLSRRLDAFIAAARAQVRSATERKQE